jgi:paraquat-inducible protein B
MTEKPEQPIDRPIGATPVIKQRHSMSIVWIVPLVAVIIGGWLAYKSITEKGPLITVTFQTAKGLEAGKTKVRYKNVEVGIVETIYISTELDRVDLKIRMKKEATPYLTENTSFWVIRARVTASEVSGLGTLLGGAYIGIEPSQEGAPADSFVGLEKAPIITSEMRGKRYSLNAPRLGSLNPGSPIYFRQVKVGQVVDFELDKDGKEIGIKIFIDAPYDQFVRDNSRFWLSSGLDLQLTANGLRVDTQSMVSLMIGGIAFISVTDEPSPLAKAGAQFKLYEKRDQAEKDRSDSLNDYYIEFFDSVRGLSLGAPVEFRGFQLGSVTDIELISDFENLKFSTMVRISIIQHNIVPLEETEIELEERFDHFVRGGLRAQLKTGNLLSGQLFIDLEYFQDAPMTGIKKYNDLAVLPSIPAASRTLMNDLGKFTKNLSDLPLGEISTELKKTMVGIDKLVSSPELHKAIELLNRIITELDTTIEMINTGTIPQVNTTLTEVETLVKDMDNWVSADSVLYDDLRNSLKALSEAARSITDLTDMLSRHPEALIQGKKSEGQL